MQKSLSRIVKGLEHDRNIILDTGLLEHMWLEPEMFNSNKKVKLSELTAIDDGIESDEIFEDCNQMEVVDLKIQAEFSTPNYNCRTEQLISGA